MSHRVSLLAVTGYKKIGENALHFPRSNYTPSKAEAKRK